MKLLRRGVALIRNAVALLLIGISFIFSALAAIAEDDYLP